MSCVRPHESNLESRRFRDPGLIGVAVRTVAAEPRMYDWLG